MHGTGNVILDIDHILEWLMPCEWRENCRFLVAPAFLIFREACDFRISLDYMASSAALQPAMISELKRQEITYPNGFKSFEWVVELNWPQGNIQLKATSVELEIRTSAVECENQSLSAEERKVLLASNNSLQARRP